MAKQKHKPRRKQQGIMGRSDLPLALRKKIEQQERIRVNRENAARVALYAYSIAMNDTFGYGREVQDRIRIRVEELTARYAKEGIGPLLEGMEKIGFYIHGGRAIHFSDEEGNIVTAKKALGQYAANNRQVAGK